MTRSCAPARLATYAIHVWSRQWNELTLYSKMLNFCWLVLTELCWDVTPERYRRPHTKSFKNNQQISHIYDNGMWWNVSVAMFKKTLRETQTLRAGCSEAEPKKFCPAADILPGVAGRPKFNQLERVTIPSPTDPAWWRSMHAISSYRSKRPTHTNTQTDPQTGPIEIHCAAKLSAQCNKLYIRICCN